MRFKTYMEQESAQAAKPKKVLWSGVQLDRPSRERLNAALKPYLEPLLQQGWQQANRPPPGTPPELLPDHMTVVAMKELPPDMKAMLGTTQQMVAVRWGQSDQAAAVEVRSAVRSQNGVPHVTVAISPTGKPFHSNQIQNWTDLEQEIPLSGTVVEKTPY